MYMLILCFTYQKDTNIQPEPTSTQLHDTFSALCSALEGQFCLHLCLSFCLIWSPPIQILPSGSSLITMTFPKCLLRSSFKPLSLSLGMESEAMHPQPSTHLHQQLQSLATPLPCLYSKQILNCPLRQLWTRLRMKTSSLAFSLSTPMTLTTAHLPDLPAPDSLVSSPLLILPLAFATPWWHHGHGHSLLVLQCL